VQPVTALTRFYIPSARLIAAACFTAVLIPPQMSVVEPLDCVVIEHAGQRGANEKFEPKNATRAEAFPYAKERVPFD
jgi:hypothetical protein